MSDIDMRITGGPRAASKARHAVETLAGRLDDALLHDLRLLVTELVTNSIRHAGIGPDREVRLRIRLSRRHLRVEVHDPGPGFRARRSPQPAEDKASGWGLFFVDRMADRWGVDDRRGTLVWFEMDC